MKFASGLAVGLLVFGVVGFVLGYRVSDSRTQQSSDLMVAVTTTATQFANPSSSSSPSLTPTAVSTRTSTPAATESLRVELSGKTFIPKDIYGGRFSDGVNFEFTYTNTGEKAIRGFTGTAVFMDLFERPFKKLSLTYDSPIQPGESVRDADKGYELNQFIEADQQLGATDFENITFRFDVEALLFTDGTQVGQAR